MEIEDSFRVELPVEETWRVLLDIERIAPCLPGAQLQEIAGEEYRGIVKVKVGPITAQYKGSAHFVERNDTTHTAVIVGTGRDTRGQGNASATITMSLAPDGEGTHVRVATDLSITGKVAQFGRGVMADVSAKLLNQFVENLERDVLSGPTVDLVAEAEVVEVAAVGVTADVVVGETAAGKTGAAVADRAPGGSPATNGSSGTDSITVRTIDAPEAVPVDLLEMGGSPIVKRLVPIVGIAVVLALLWLWRRRRSAR